MAYLLIVDDENTTSDLLIAVLQKDGHTLHTAKNGAEALATLGERTPDLILMDVSMPEMDGYTMVSHLSADTATRDIPVIVMTGKNALEDTFRQFTNVADFFAKPFDVKILRQRVLQILAQHGRR